MLKKLISVIGCLFVIMPLQAQLKVSPYFKDHIVLQRNIENEIWGTCLQKETVYLSIAGNLFTAKSDRHGVWRLNIPPFKAGGPHVIKISTEKEQILIKDVLFGDVWLCSGQSNMEYSVSSFSWGKDEEKVAQNTNIRFLEVPNRIEEIAVDELPEEVEWKIAKEQNIRALSAVSYWFAKYIQPEIQVPVGLITSDWSGTSIEPWMPLESLKKFSQFKEVTDYLTEDPKTHDQINHEFKEYLEKDWGPNYYYKGIGLDEKWFDQCTDYSTWDTIQLPCWWEDAGLGLENYDGSVWFRTTFDLPEDFDDASFLIDLNLIKDYDMVWLNGVKLGETFGDQNWRHYWADKSILKEDSNSLVVRVYNVKGNGGINYHPLWASKILSGEWVCKKGTQIQTELVPIPRIVNKSPFGYPNAIYNAMINPLLNVQITGAIWYQGESNASRAEEYIQLFPAMVKAWRRAFNQGDFPFYFVQLANFEKEVQIPQESDWAEMREAQESLLQLPNTGMAIAIDLGEEDNIHPSNKQELGKRLALQALKKNYKKDVIAESPKIKSIEVIGDSIVLEVETYGSQLQCNNKYGYINGFALASGDQKFEWAKSVLRGDKIVVYSEKVKNPQHVRYAWSKNPGHLNLYNTEGLPLRPFRSDKWKGITSGRVFSLDTVYF